MLCCCLLNLLSNAAFGIIAQWCHMSHVLIYASWNATLFIVVFAVSELCAYL